MIYARFFPQPHFQSLYTLKRIITTKMAPTVQKAVVVQHDGSVALREVAVPKPGPDEILVKVVAAAQNPTDCGWEVSTIIIIHSTIN
jgi:hypothetical protein